MILGENDDGSAPEGGKVFDWDECCLQLCRLLHAAPRQLITSSTGLYFHFTVAAASLGDQTVFDIFICFAVTSTAVATLCRDLKMCVVGPLLLHSSDKELLQCLRPDLMSKALPVYRGKMVIKWSQRRRSTSNPGKRELAVRRHKAGHLEEGGGHGMIGDRDRWLEIALAGTKAVGRWMA